MLNLPNADANNKFEVLKVSDSHKLWEIAKGKSVVLEYNGAWQPVGKSELKFRCMTCKIVRNGAFIRISNNWMKVPKNTKEDVYSSLMICVI
jgi:hypothetical protein